MVAPLQWSLACVCVGGRKWCLLKLKNYSKEKSQLLLYIIHKNQDHTICNTTWGNTNIPCNITSYADASTTVQHSTFIFLNDYK